MTEPQVWTLIGVFGAALFGMLTLTSTMFVRVVRTEIGGLRGEMRAEIGSLRSEIAELGAEMSVRFESVEKRFDYLERDAQALAKRALGE